MTTTLSSLDVNALRPYLSGTFLTSKSPKSKDKALLTKLMSEAQTVLAARTDRTLLSITKPQQFKTLFAGTLTYSQETTPAWHPTSKLKDIEHHCISVLCRGHRCVVVTSDSSFRKALIAGFTVAEPLSRKIFSEAFVGPSAKAMWLDGVHTHSDFKADGKVLLGNALENAVDPLGDHTFAISAIKSNPAIKNLLKNVGASLSTRSLWIGRATSWNVFIDQIEALLDHLDSSPTPTNAYKHLAQPIDDLSVLNNAYEIAVLPSILIGDDEASTPAQLSNAEYWANEALYAVTSRSGGNFDVKVTVEGTDIGTFRAKINTATPEKIGFSGSWSKTSSANMVQQEKCERFLTDPEQIKVYYDSGHTISFGQCFESGWTDQLYDWTYRDFTGFDVDTEKPSVVAPNKLADCIGTTADTSLFGYVVKKLYTKGWLACDDGSMELADFVHLDPTTGLITLIHVKGSSTAASNRQVSVADYEIVVSQGVKNIRHLRASNLVEKLEKDKTKDICRATWHNGAKQPDRTGMISALKKLPDSTPRRLMILQPRLSESEKNYCMAPGAPNQRVLRFKQLNALILSGRVSAMSAGADFVAIAAK